MKIKLFTSFKREGHENIAKEVNDFLAQTGRQVKDIKFSSNVSVSDHTAAWVYNILVVYD